MPLLRFLCWWRVPCWGIQLPIHWVVAAAYFFTIDVSAAAYLTETLRISSWLALFLPAAYLSNDFFDRHDDIYKRGSEHDTVAPDNPSARRAGAHAAVKLALAMFLTTAGVGLVYHQSDSAGIRLIAWVMVLGSVAYSAPGLRLKERGLAGVLTAASLQRIPALVMQVLCFPANGSSAAVLSVWLLVMGVIFIIEHQLGIFFRRE